MTTRSYLRNDLSGATDRPAARTADPRIHDANLAAARALSFPPETSASHAQAVRDFIAEGLSQLNLRWSDFDPRSSSAVEPARVLHLTNLINQGVAFGIFDAELRAALSLWFTRSGYAITLDDTRPASRRALPVALAGPSVSVRAGQQFAVSASASPIG